MGNPAKSKLSIAEAYDLLAVFFVGSLIGYVWGDFSDYRKGTIAHIFVPFLVAFLPFLLGLWWRKGSAEDLQHRRISFLLTVIVLTGVWAWCFDWFLERRTYSSNSPIPSGPETTRFIYAMFGWIVLLALYFVPKWSALLPIRDGNTSGN